MILLSRSEEPMNKLAECGASLASTFITNIFQIWFDVSGVE